MTFFLGLQSPSSVFLHVAQELFTHLIGVELCVNFFVTPLFAVGDIDGANINCSGNDDGVLMTADDDEFGVTGGWWRIERGSVLGCRKCGCFEVQANTRAVRMSVWDATSVVTWRLLHRLKPWR